MIEVNPRPPIACRERGASLVADAGRGRKYVGGDLVAAAPDLSRGYMEIRGIGIVNVANIFGLASIRPDKRLDMVVTLKPHADLNEVDRLGMRQSHEILGQKVSHVRWRSRSPRGATPRAW